MKNIILTLVFILFFASFIYLFSYKALNHNNIRSAGWLIVWRRSIITPSVKNKTHIKSYSSEELPPTAKEHLSGRLHIPEQLHMYLKINIRKFADDSWYWSVLFVFLHHVYLLRLRSRLFLLRLLFSLLRLLLKLPDPNNLSSLVEPLQQLSFLLLQQSEVWYNKPPTIIRY